MPPGVAGPLIGAGASIFAASKQASAAKKGIRAQEAAREQARADLQPFVQAGSSQLNQLTSIAGQGLDVPLERAQGFRDIQNSAAAGGNLNSGGTLKELTSFNNMLNARNRSLIFNQLFNVATLGANAASGQATASINTGNQISDLFTQRGNAQAAGIAGAANSLTDNSFLNAFKQSSSTSSQGNNGLVIPGIT